MTVPALPGRRRRVLYNELNEDGTVGGSHRCLHDLVLHLDRSRFEPVVVFYQRNPYVERLRALGVEVHVWEDERRREVAGPGRWHRSRLAIGLARAVRLRATFLRRERIDLVHLNNSPIPTAEDWLPAIRLAGRPVVCHCRAAVRPEDGSLRRWLAGRFDRIVAISCTVRDSLRRAGIPESKIALVYDGVDLTALRASASADPDATRRGFGVGADGFLVVMVGHLRAWKGQHVLLDALGLLDPAVLSRTTALLVGDLDSWNPSYAAELGARASAPPLGSRVRLLGARDDAADLMRAADVLVHASTSPEPLGLVVLEGMALGRPVVASRLGGPAETVAPGTGLLFDPSRPEELAAHLDRLANDPALRDALGRAGARQAERFGIEACLEATQALYEDLL